MIVEVALHEDARNFPILFDMNKVKDDMNL